MLRALALIACLLLALPASAAEPRLAISEFDNAADTDTYDALGKGLQAMITTDLAQVEGWVLVERDRLSAVTAELDLQQSALVDPATAAAVGRLLGASHVVLGTFTVVGDTMRLDARVVAVGTSEVAAVATAEGERDAFFELEKALVKALLDALGASPSPKERAAIARIHTADFGAFETFSEGVALYDAARYEEAVATLERVLKKDAEFQLAERTLASYESLVADIRAKARALELTQAEQAFVARQEKARDEAAIVAYLQERADDEAAPWQDRAAALYLLTLGLYSRGNHGGFRELKSSEDEFALDRAAEVAWARLYAETRPHWPQNGPFSLQSPGTWFAPGEKDAATSFEDLKARVFSNKYSPLVGCKIDPASKRLETYLHLDLQERATELEGLVAEGADCIGEDKTREMYREIAGLYHQRLDLDRSTAVLEAMAAATDDPRRLDEIGHLVDANREVAAILAEPGAPTFRETVMLEQRGKPFATYFNHHWLEEAREGGPRGLWELSRRRHLGDEVFPEPLWWRDTLTWVLPGSSGELASGPRSEPSRTTSLRYYGNGVPKMEFDRLREPEPPSAVWVLFGAGPRRDVTVSLALDSRPADDWWPIQLPPPREGEAPRETSDGTPLVGVLFGVVDVDVPAICDPSGVGMTSVPMRGWAVLLEDTRVRLARIQEVDPDWSEKRCSHFTDYVDAWVAEDVAEAAIPTARAPRGVQVEVQGTAVTVRVDKTTRRFTLPEPVAGYPGLLVQGVGYVELSEPEVR